MLLKHPRKQRVVALGLLLTFVQSIICPTIGWALTSGPTTPEATSFEPVDTTDMVNLQTGDFTNSIRLIEVPAPEGGYHLALSYHAGIKPLEDASWVGLGWSLSPGAINRAVNGYPDDQFEVRRHVEDYWSGGTSESYSVGIGIGAPAGANFNLAYSWSNDTYKGFNGELSMSITYGLRVGVGKGRVGLSGGLYASTSGVVGTSVGVTAFYLGSTIRHSHSLVGMVSTHGGATIHATSSIGTGPLTASYQMTYASGAGAGVKWSSSLGYSLRSRQLGGSVSVSGLGSSTANNRLGNISSSQRGIQISLGVIDFSYRYLRYWLFERDWVNISGTLHASKFDDFFTASNCEELANTTRAFDKISLPSYLGRDPSRSLGGSFAATDVYQVAGQGISGNIKPYFYYTQVPLIGKSKSLSTGNNSSYAMSYQKLNDLNYSSDKVQFRFVNDFSNAITASVNDLTYDPNIACDGGNGAFLPGSSTFSTPPAGYNGSTNFLAGSQHVAWYTNQEIVDGTARGKGLMDYPGMLPADRMEFDNWNTPGLDIKAQIGAYSITNGEGVTYHYALPAYTYDEYHSSTILSADNQNNGTVYNRQENFHPYAYTWLLTAITGPDFVDRGADGISDGQLGEEDWGYWVAFDYGRWTGNFQWRTPSEGVFHDINSRAQTYSYGKKELYYLDAIRTRTHTGLFVKDIRQDGKGVSGRAGGFGTGNVTIHPHCEAVCEFGPPTPYEYVEPCSKSWEIGPVAPTSVLKLNEILLFRNADLRSEANSIADLKDNGHSSYSQSFNFNGTLAHDHCAPELPTICDYYDGACTACINYSRCDLPPNDVFRWTYHHEANVIDQNDIGTSLRQKALRTIKLSTDYSLSPETPNSYVNTGVYTSSPQIPSERSGKLTLRSVKFFGRNDTSILPSINFEYDQASSLPYDFDLQLSASGGDPFIEITGADANWEDRMVKCTDLPTGKDYYLLLTQYRYDSQAGAWGFDYEILGGNVPSHGFTGANLVITKNPPFNRNKVDLWGYYKNDFTEASDYPLGDVLRFPSDQSCQSIDAWSLQSIETSLGGFIEVEYEPRNFTGLGFDGKKEVLQCNLVRIENPAPGAATTKVSFPDLDDPSFLFSVGDMIDLTTKLQDLTVATSSHQIMGIEPATSSASGRLLIRGPAHRWDANRGFVSYRLQDLAHPMACLGDGIRVRKIKVRGNTSERATVYAYSNGKSSYLPSSHRRPWAPIATSINSWRAYYDEYQKTYDYLFAKSHLAPGPGVLHGTVKVMEEADGQLLPGAKRYHFQPFDASMIDIQLQGYGPNGAADLANVKIKNKTGGVGSLLRTEVLDGDDRIISQTEMTYSTDPVAHAEQGRVDQVFTEAWKLTFDAQGTNHLYGQKTELEEYPHFLVSTTTTEAERIAITKNVAYDFYTGLPTVVESENLHGEKFRTKSIAAYHQYPEMGLKVHDPNNRHMLEQQTFSETVKIDDWDGNEIGFVDASAATWTKRTHYRILDEPQPNLERYIDVLQDNGIYRKHETYYYRAIGDPDGTYATRDNFNWLGSQTSNWQRGSEITRYDRYSKPLEAKDINGNYAATKMGYDQSLPLATASPARYAELYYSGAEDLIVGTNWFGGEVQNRTGVQSADYAHTGEYSVKLGPSQSGNTQYGFQVLAQLGPSGIQTDGAYRAQVWVRDNGDLAKAKMNYYFRDVNGNDLTGFGGSNVAADNYSVRAGDWVLLDLDINIPNTLPSDAYLIVTTLNESTTTPAYFDDFRLAPLSASMTSYVYDPDTDALRFVLDADNRYTEYQYDAAGRLRAVYRETTENPTGRRLVSEHGIDYAREF